jgi:hypothetical protein
MLNTEQQLRDGIHAQVEVAYNKLKETAQNYQSTSESVALLRGFAAGQPHV